MDYTIRICDRCGKYIECRTNYNFGDNVTIVNVSSTDMDKKKYTWVYCPECAEELVNFTNSGGILGKLITMRRFTDKLREEL